jgi:catechol 2,3-dioxygenase-like lactoylglutathione lyase family enzyme
MSDETPLMPAQLFSVTLGTQDVARQRRFYEGWGWQAAPYSSEEYVAFNLNGVTVAFYPTAKLGEEAAPGESLPAAGVWNGVTVAVNVPAKEDVDRVWQAASDSGAKEIGKPVDRVWGGRSGYVADPDGNRWEIAWVPPMG